MVFDIYSSNNKDIIYMSIGGFLWTLGAQAWRTRSCCNINICIVYQLPTFWEFSKFPKCWQLIYNTNIYIYIYIYILHQLKLYIEGCLCALRAQGSVTYIFLYIYSYWIEAANIWESIYWIYPANYWGICVSWRVSAPGP